MHSWLPAGVDAAFESLLCAVFGSELVAGFRRRHSAAYIDLMVAWESRYCLAVARWCSVSCSV